MKRLASERAGRSALDSRATVRLSSTWLWLAAGLLIGLELTAVALSTIARLQQPTELLYGEAVVLNQVHRVEAGLSLYPPVDSLPLTITAYTLQLHSPRWWHCSCCNQSTRTFSPLAAALPRRTTPELLYLETKTIPLRSQCPPTV
jgi:hypothetical protein